MLPDSRNSRNFSSADDSRYTVFYTKVVTEKNFCYCCMAVIVFQNSKYTEIYLMDLTLAALKSNHQLNSVPTFHTTEMYTLVVLAEAKHSNSTHR